MDARRIAIFQADWALDSQTINCALMLAEAEYSVELFLCYAGTENGYAKHELDRIRNDSRIVVHDLTRRIKERHSCPVPRTDSLLKLASQKLLGRLSRPIVRSARRMREFCRERLHPESFVLSRMIVDEAMDLMAKRKYTCLIGVEKKGLIWAGQIGCELNVPTLYYSLELYVDDHWRVRLNSAPEFKVLRRAERRYHRRVSATIIQDRDRAQVLCRSNGVRLSGGQVYYLPVSFLEQCARHQRQPITSERRAAESEKLPARPGVSRYLRDKLRIPEDHRIILYIGQISEKRRVLDLIKVAQGFPDDWVLVVHGWRHRCNDDDIKLLDAKQRVRFSFDLVPAEVLVDLVSSADIGLALYSSDTANDRLTAFSSAKMALYTRCGVPFISFNYPGYDRLAKVDRCGMTINSIGELPVAIGAILSEHDEYRENAAKAYLTYYDFAKNFEPILRGIECFATDTPAMPSEAMVGTRINADLPIATIPGPHEREATSKL